MTLHEQLNEINDVRKTKRKAASVSVAREAAIASARVADDFQKSRTNTEQLDNVVSSHRRVKAHFGADGSNEVTETIVPDGYIESVNGYGGLK